MKRNRLCRTMKDRGPALGLALLVWGGLVFRAAGAETLTNDYGGRDSDWSAAVDGLQIRARVAPHIKASRRQTFALHVGCEIRNVGAVTRLIKPAARVWAVDAQGTRIKCLKEAREAAAHTAEVSPGASLSWVQEGVLETDGAYTLSVSWDDNPALESPPLPCRVERTDVFLPNHNSPLFKDALRAAAPRLPAASVNTDPAQIGFADLALSHPPLVVDGFLYAAFKFTVPREGHLIWAFVPQGNGLQEWYILPVAAGAVSFQNAEMRQALKAIPGVAVPGDRITLQQLPQPPAGDPSAPSALESGKEYLIWFRTATDAPVVLRCSMNILPETAKDCRRYFPALYEASKESY